MLAEGLAGRAGFEPALREVKLPDPLGLTTETVL